MRILSFLNRDEKIGFFGIIFILNIAAILESIILMSIVPYVGIVTQDPVMIDRFAYILSDDLTNLQAIFWTVTLIFFLMIILKFVLQLVSSYFVAKFPYSVYKRKTNAIFDQYLNEDYLAHAAKDTGTLVKHCTQTNYYACQAVSYQLQIYSNISVIFFLLVGMLIQDVWNSLLLIIFFVTIACFFWKYNRQPVQKLGKELVDSSKAAYQWVIESLHLFKEIRIYHKSNYFQERFNECVTEISENYRQREWLSKLPVVILEFVAITILLAIVSYVYLFGQVTGHFVAMLIFYAVAGRRILPALNLVTQQAIYLSHAYESLLAFEGELEQGITTPRREIKPAIRFEKKIQFENVSFWYDAETPILSGISFEVEKNQSVAFVGPSGGGKSTIVNMLTGLLIPDKGVMHVDHQIVSDLTPLQRLIGYVPQSISLINDTIAKNIALGEESIDFDRLNEVIVQSHLTDFIANLPSGIETIVGDKGIRVSGGQMQRIGIARALYRRPEILIFDEATSSLDQLSEMAISQSIRGLTGRKTLVAIAHRLSTVKYFDKIYVLNRGRIISAGNHETLIQTCSLYQQLNSSTKENLICAE